MLLFGRHRPDHAGHLVGQRHGCHHPRLARDQLGQPAIGATALAHDPSDHTHCADDQKSADVALSHLADRAQPDLAPGGSLSGHQAQPSGKVATAIEGREIRCEGGNGTRSDWTNARHGAEPLQLLVSFRGAIKFISHLFNKLGQTTNLVKVECCHLAHWAG